MQQKNGRAGLGAAPISPRLQAPAQLPTTYCKGFLAFVILLWRFFRS